MREIVRPRLSALQAIALASAFLSTLLGAIVLVGWYTRNTRLIQVNESFVPMQYNTALCFLLLGISLALVVFQRVAWAQLTLLPVFAIGVLTLVEYVFRVSIGIDQLFMKHYITVETSHPGRMAPNTALCFTLSSLAILVGRSFGKSNFGAERMGLLASTTIGFAFVAFAGYAASIESAYGWGQLTRMAVHTSIGFLVVGIGLFALALHATKSILVARWISIAAGIGMIAAGVGLWQALANEQQRRVRNQIQSRSDELLAVIELTFESRALALERMASRWEARGGIGQETLWRSDARTYISTITGFRALEWVDRSNIVRWVEPIAGNENAVGLNLGIEEQRRSALLNAQTTGLTTATSAIELVQGGQAILLFAPIGKGDSCSGFILGVFDVDELFDNLIESVRGDFDVSVLEGDSRIYGTPHENLGTIHTLKLLEREWQFQLTTDEEYQAFLESSLPTQVLFGSIAVAILATITIFLAQTSYENLQAVREAEAALMDRERYLRGVVEALPIGLLTVDNTGTIRSINTGALKIFGYEENELLGENVNVLVPPEFRRLHPAHIARYFADPEPRAMRGDRELFGQTKRGNPIPVEIGLAPIRVRGLPHVLATVVDISERRKARDVLTLEVEQRTEAEHALAVLNAELEERVAERTESLEAANRELNEFTYVASHDLQEPLRKQQMFTSILEEELGGDLSDDAKRSMQAIRNASIRMQDLVQSLLALSRARNRELTMRRVSLKKLAEDALDGISLRVTETNAEVEIGDLPEITCDAILVHQVFQNLLQNALRFTLEGARPKIQVNAEVREGEVEIAVRDEGIGIAPSKLDEVFKPFKRLHTRNEYPGTGIGLAICKKIVDRHGGRIWVDSESSNGCTFRFTLSSELEGEEDV